MPKTFAFLCFLALTVVVKKTIAQSNADSFRLSIDVSMPSSEKLDPVWAYFGYDEPNYTYMKDGRKLLTELADMSSVPVFVRCHHLLVTGDGSALLKWGSTNMYTEDAKGRPIYSWSIADSIFDTYIERGMKPLAQIGFMPEALSVQPESDGYQVTPARDTVKHYTGWNYPPKDYKKFGELVYQWVKHCVEKYGREEVESWLWQVWNEPDIFYWKGTMEEYFKLYDYSADALKRALPTAKIGGPETTNPGSKKAGDFLQKFLEHVVSGKNYVTGKTGSPIDFITFHAKGQPEVIEGRVWMNMGVQLRHIDKGFEIVSSFPTLKKLPIVIGESDPEGCAACPADIFPNNDYRNGTLYASYTAASFARLQDLAKLHDVNLLGAVTWAFEFEDQPWFRGFRDLATNGVDKPVLNVFRMFGQMQGNRIPVESNATIDLAMLRDSSVRGTLADVNAIATTKANEAYVLVWNYHDKNDLDVAATPVHLLVKGLSGKKLNITHFRVDQDHSNAYTQWKTMGRPQSPSQEEYKKLEQAGQLQLLGSPEWKTVEQGRVELSFDLPRQAVSLLKISW